MVKFVYFDVGGVLMHDFSTRSRWDGFLEALKLNPEKYSVFDEAWFRLTEHSLTGFDVDQILPILNKEFELGLGSEFSLLENLVGQFAKNSYLDEIVNLVSRRCEVGLLTNMYPRMLELIFEQNIVDEKKWDVVIDSSKVAVAKPDQDIYALAEEKSGYSGDQIFFIDNLVENLSVPRTLGWQTFLYDIQSKSNLHKLRAHMRSLF